MLLLSLNVIGDRLGLDDSCIRIASCAARQFSGVRLYDDATPKLRAGMLYVVDPEDITPDMVSSAQCGFALTCMPATPMAACDYLYMDLPTSKSELLGQILYIFEYIGQWVTDFQRFLLDGGSFDRLPGMIYELIPHPHYICDTSFKILAMSDHPDMQSISVSWRYFCKYRYMPLDLVERMRSSGDIERMKSFTTATFYHSANFNDPFITYTLHDRSHTIGFFFVIGIYQSIKPCDMELANLVGGILSSYMGSSASFKRTNGLLHEGFLRDVLTGKLTNGELIRSQLRTFKWRDSDVYCLLRTGMDSDDYRLQHDFSEKLASVRDSRSVYHDGGLISIIKLPGFAAYNDVCASLAACAESMKRRCMVSEPFTGFGRMRSFYYQVTYSPASPGPSPWLTRFREHMAEYILSYGVSGAEDISTLCIQNLFDMLEFDHQNGTELYNTLDTYLMCERSLVGTAKALYIHRNTLVFRLEKIAKQFGDFELDSPNIRLAFRLSTRLIDRMPRSEQA